MHLFEVEIDRVDGGVALSVKLLVFNADTFLILFCSEFHLIRLACSSFAGLTHLFKDYVSKLSAFGQFDQVLSYDMLIASVLNELNVDEPVRIVAVF